MYREHWIDPTFNRPWTLLEEIVMKHVSSKPNKILSIEFYWVESLDMFMPEWITRLAIRRLIQSHYLVRYMPDDHNRFKLTNTGNLAMSRKRAYEMQYEQ